MKSQQQTAEYFQRFASEWRRKVDGAHPGKANVIRQRNEFVLAVAGELEKPGRALDLGCGAGEHLLLPSISSFAVHSVLAR